MNARLAAVSLFACLTMAATAQDLGSLVSEARAEWMFAKWEAQSDNGETVTLNISWELKKNFVLLHVNAGDMEIKGYTYKDPDAEQPKYIAFDDRGAVSKGTWAFENEELVLRTDTKSTERGTQRMGFVFTGSSSEGLKVRMHSLDSSDSLESPARTTLKFKKKA